MDPFYKVPYGQMSGYQLYRQFKAAERDFEKSEVDKAYRDVLNRLQIQMSTLLHDYDLTLGAYRTTDHRDPHNRECYDELYKVFYEYDTKARAFMYRVADRLRNKVTQTLNFHYDMSGYKVDPNENCFRDTSYYMDELKERLKIDQVGKDLLLIAYSPIDYIQYYGGNKESSVKPKVTKLLSPPTAKKPRVVPLPIKRPHTPKPYSPKPYIPPTKKSK